jgi:hypothetical protein
MPGVPVFRFKRGETPRCVSSVSMCATCHGGCAAAMNSPRLTQGLRHPSTKCASRLATPREQRLEQSRHAPFAGPHLARAGCCVAPSMCLAASKRVARALQRAAVPWAAKPRATASLRAFHATGTGFALSLAIGSTWIRRACNTKYSLQDRSGQRRPSNSVIDWVRGTPFFISGIRFRPMPYGVARNPAH